MSVGALAATYLLRYSARVQQLSSVTSVSTMTMTVLLSNRGPPRRLPQQETGRHTTVSAAGFFYWDCPWLRAPRRAPRPRLCRQATRPATHLLTDISTTVLLPVIHHGVAHPRPVQPPQVRPSWAPPSSHPYPPCALAVMLATHSADRPLISNHGDGKEEATI